MNRKEFIKQNGIILSGIFFMPLVSNLTGKKKPVIIVVSGWQDVNIGDVAHTPGLFAILNKFIPQATIILWKQSRGKKVEDMLLKDFPSIKILYGNVDSNNKVDNPEINKAFEKADMMIHSSGPGIVARRALNAWLKYSSKPFGIFGVTISSVYKSIYEILEKSSFTYTRETASLKILKSAGFSGNNISFAPDATFYLNIHNEPKAWKFMIENKLEDKKFICAIPRLRKTPYYKTYPGRHYTKEKIRQINELNNKHKEIDHAKLRVAMVTWVRETGNKVLVCPEMTYEVDIMDELLIDPLPEDVKPYVVKHGYWLPDEAASIYAKAHTVLSLECHSPIIAITNGTPAFYLREPEDTIKGQMYYDLGFDNWVFEIEQIEGKDIANRLREVWQNYDQAKTKIASVMKKITNIYSEKCNYVNKILES